MLKENNSKKLSDAARNGIEFRDFLTGRTSRHLTRRSMVNEEETGLGIWRE